jgi:hypothetical protein
VNRPHFNDNPQPSQNRGASPRPAPVGPETGSPFQPSRNGNENNNPPTPRRNQPVPPVQTPGQRQVPPVATPGSPGHNGMTPPAEHSSPPVNHYAPLAPVQPSAPNYNSTDTRHYPSPKAQQTEQENPRANPGNSGGRVNAPVTPQPTAPAQPPQNNSVSPRNQTPPTESRPNYSQPAAAGNQSRGSSAPASAPAQSQRSGGGRNQNGQQ